MKAEPVGAAAGAVQQAFGLPSAEPLRVEQSLGHDSGVLVLAAQGLQVRVHG